MNSDDKTEKLGSTLRDLNGTDENDVKGEVNAGKNMGLDPGCEST
jgi:hypothetical protein